MGCQNIDDLIVDISLNNCRGTDDIMVTSLNWCRGIDDIMVDISPNNCKSIDDIS